MIADAALRPPYFSGIQGIDGFNRSNRYQIFRRALGRAGPDAGAPGNDAERRGARTRSRPPEALDSDRVGRAGQGAIESQVEADREKILRSPTLIVVGCCVREHPKVPAIEQIVAAGAAVENLFLAAHALGYGVMWKTGAAAYDADVKTGLGLSPSDHIVGIIHVGTRLK
jgi:nitroreductase